MITKDNIFEEAKRCNLEVLKSDLVDKARGKNSWTPLHELACGWVKEILDHPSVDKVKDAAGNTPLCLLAWNNHITKKDLRKKYPWYKKEIKNIREAVEEIVNTPTSIKFILED